jgi:hypothetical protein
MYVFCIPDAFNIILMTYGIKLIAGFRIFKSIPAARQMAGYLFLDALYGHFTEIGFATACILCITKELCFVFPLGKYSKRNSALNLLLVSSKKMGPLMNK